MNKTFMKKIGKKRKAKQEVKNEAVHNIADCLPGTAYAYKVFWKIHDVSVEKKPFCINTGIKELDEIIGGFCGGELVTICSRPSSGKTSFAISMVNNFIYKRAQKVKAGFFSLETSGRVLIERLIAINSSISPMRLREGKLSWSEHDDICQLIYDMNDSSVINLSIYDRPNTDVKTILSCIRHMVRNNGAKVIFIDSIQMIEDNTIIRALKKIALELDITIICLTNIWREAGKDRPPMLADLREYGLLEHFADIILLLDDPTKRIEEQTLFSSVCNGGELDIKARDFQKPRKLRVAVAKNRYDNTGSFDIEIPF